MQTVKQLHSEPGTNIIQKISYSLSSSTSMVQRYRRFLIVPTILESNVPNSCLLVRNVVLPFFSKAAGRFSCVMTEEAHKGTSLREVETVRDLEDHQVGIKQQHLGLHQGGLD